MSSGKKPYVGSDALRKEAGGGKCHISEDRKAPDQNAQAIGDMLEDISLIDRQVGTLMKKLAIHRSIDPTALEAAAGKIRASRECLQDARIGLVSLSLRG